MLISIFRSFLGYVGGATYATGSTIFEGVGFQWFVEGAFVENVGKL